MDILMTILAIIQMIIAVVVIFFVLLQSDKEGGSIVAGNQNSVAGMSKDAKMSKLTAYIGTAFVIITIATSTVIMYVNAK